MAATSISAAKNRMARAVESILDPWPSSTQPVWDFFASECAYCGRELIKSERRGHMDHATPRAGNHLGNLVLACSTCNGDEKLDMDWAEFLERKVPNEQLRQQRAARISQWQELHPKPQLFASREIAALKSELGVRITEFGEKCGELRDAVKTAQVGDAEAPGDEANAGLLEEPDPGRVDVAGIRSSLIALGFKEGELGVWSDAEASVTVVVQSTGAFVWSSPGFVAI